ncbi:MAG: NTP transferase domain-containing protein [Janthinobacterium lividum]
MTRDIVIPAGGVIGADFAALIGSPYRALAPIGPGRMPVLQHIVDTLRSAEPDARVICVAPEAVSQAVQNVDLWLPAGVSGPENIRLGLSYAIPEQPALLCTSDLPLMTIDSVKTFINACRSDVQLTVGLVHADDYNREFTDAPPSEFTSLSETGPITLAGLFQIQPDLLTCQSALFDKLFSARKEQWRLASLIGPKLLWQFATKTLTLSALTRRAEHLIGGPVQIIFDTAPVLAYDIDTADDYTYATTHFGN